MTLSNSKRVVVLCCMLLLHGAVAHAQTAKEQLYTFKVPIHLTQLGPSLGIVVLHCYATLSSRMAPNVDPSSHHELRVVNARVDTVVTARLQVMVPTTDIGTPGKYYCDLFGR